MRQYNIMILNTNDNMVKMHHEKSFGIMGAFIASTLMQDEECPDEKYRIISIEEIEA